MNRSNNDYWVESAAELLDLALETDVEDIASHDDTSDPRAMELQRESAHARCFDLEAPPASIVCTDETGPTAADVNASAEALLDQVFPVDADASGEEKPSAEKPSSGEEKPAADAMGIPACAMANLVLAEHALAEPVKFGKGGSDTRKHKSLKKKPAAADVSAEAPSAADASGATRKHKSLQKKPAAADASAEAPSADADASGDEKPSVAADASGDMPEIVLPDVRVKLDTKQKRWIVLHKKDQLMQVAFGKFALSPEDGAALTKSIAEDVADRLKRGFPPSAVANYKKSRLNALEKP